MRAEQRHRRSARIGLLLAGLVLAPAAVSAPPIAHWTLENGARVYFIEARELPMVQLSVLFDAGSARDPSGRSGLAWLGNRLLREGAGGLTADEIAERFEDLGAEFGNDSQRDTASLSLRSLSERRLLDPALDLFARLLALPDFPEAALARERTRALVALRQSRQQPGEVASRAFYELLYGDHPYAGDPRGSEAGLQAVTRADLVAHHRRYYVGANALLALVGDLSRAEAEELAQRLLGQLPAGAPAAAPPAVAAPARAVQKHIPHPSSQSHILMGQPGVARADPDYFPLLVGNYTLGGSGLVSRLARELREKRGLSYGMYSYFLPMRERGPFVLGLQTKNAQRDEALAIARRTLAEFVASGPSAEELAAARKNLTGGFALRLDSNRKLVEQLALIGFYRLPLDYLDTFIARIEAVTLEQVRAALARRLQPDQMVTVTVGGAR